MRRIVSCADTRDKPELPLSRTQLEVFDGWKRAEEAIPPPTWPLDHEHDNHPTMSFVNSMDLVQDAATDCSVVASLCALSARAERGHAKVSISAHAS